MLEEICAYLHNYFQYEILFGVFAIEDGELYAKACASLPADMNINGILKNDQYIRVVGSVMNDGIYKAPTFGFDQDEEFNGAVWLMAVPREFKTLVSDIEDWTANNQSVIDSPYTSESFGGYSYSKASPANGTGSYDWSSHFASRLNKYRKVRDI